MKILHITPSTNGYESVELLANRISINNSLAAIRKNEQVYYTGGFLVKDTPAIRAVLDRIPKNEQYEFVKEFKMEPFESFKFFEDTPMYKILLAEHESGK